MWALKSSVGFSSLTSLTETTVSTEIPAHPNFQWAVFRACMQRSWTWMCATKHAKSVSWLVINNKTNKQRTGDRSWIFFINVHILYYHSILLYNNRLKTWTHSSVVLLITSRIVFKWMHFYTLMYTNIEICSMQFWVCSRNNKMQTKINWQYFVLHALNLFTCLK